MCFHDGPGIRTTVFMKGCSIHCPWCANPENISFLKEDYIDGSKSGTYGEEYSPEELLSVLLKDYIFWGAEGGVTFSGGEPLMRADELKELLVLLKDNDINIAVETALFVPTSKLQLVLPYVDYFIVDAKILDENLCLEILGGDVDLYKKNLEILFLSGKLKLLRVPFSNEFSLQKENKKELVSLLSRYVDIPVEIFKLHSLGERKYKSLNKEMWIGSKIEKEKIEGFILELKNIGISAREIKI